MLDRSNANFMLWPPCVEVQRCSGCCNTKSLLCVPVVTHTKYLQVNDHTQKFRRMSKHSHLQDPGEALGLLFSSDSHLLFNHSRSWRSNTSTKDPLTLKQWCQWLIMWSADVSPLHVTLRQRKNHLVNSTATSTETRRSAKDRDTNRYRAIPILHKRFLNALNVLCTVCIFTAFVLCMFYVCQHWDWHIL